MRAYHAREREREGSVNCGHFYFFLNFIFFAHGRAGRGLDGRGGAERRDGVVVGLDADGVAGADEGVAERDGLGCDALLEEDGAGVALGGLDEREEQGGGVAVVAVLGADGNLHNVVVLGGAGGAGEAGAAEHDGLEHAGGEGHVRGAGVKEREDLQQLRGRGAVQLARERAQDGRVGLGLGLGRGRGVRVGVRVGRGLVPGELSVGGHRAAQLARARGIHKIHLPCARIHIPPPEKRGVPTASAKRTRGRRGGFFSPGNLE